MKLHVAQHGTQFVRAYLLTALLMQSMPTNTAVFRSWALSPQYAHSICTSVSNVSCCLMLRRTACDLKQLHLWRTSCERSRKSVPTE